MTGNQSSNIDHTTTRNHNTARYSKNRIIAVVVIATTVVLAAVVVGKVVTSRSRNNNSNDSSSSSSLRLGTGNVATTRATANETDSNTTVSAIGNTVDKKDLFDSLGVTFCPQDVQECPDGSYVGRDPNNNCAFGLCEVNCEICPGGFFDGCNQCACGKDRGALCTRMACGSDLAPKTCQQMSAEDDLACTLDVQECPDGSFVGRDPNNDCAFSPCEVSCEVCPGGFFDGCNHCSCDSQEDAGACTLMACGSELAPKICHEKPPAKDDHVPIVVCTEEARVCPDGSAVNRDPANGCVFLPCPPDAADVDSDDRPIGCDTCECGFSDGCNDCQCDENGSISCTERYCFWQGIPTCLDCSTP